MHPSRPGVRVRCLCPRLARLLGLLLFVGLTACGNPSPDAPVSGHISGSADAVVSPPAGDAPRAGLAAHEPAVQAPTPTFPLGPPAPPAAPAGARSTVASRAGSPAPDARVQQAAAPADPPQPDEQTTADQAQRAAWELWIAELRESPDATVRLQALELWAQQPGDTIDPVTFALVDEDEDVRTRAEALWEQQLAREASVP